MGDGASWRNSMIDTYGMRGGEIALAREVWFTVVRDADAIQRGKVPDSYRNDMMAVKGALSTGRIPGQTLQRARESVEEFLHHPDNLEDRRRWAELGFDCEPDELAKRVPSTENREGVGGCRERQSSGL